jgi:hypothetical protein
MQVASLFVVRVPQPLSTLGSEDINSPPQVRKHRRITLRMLDEDDDGGDKEFKVSRGLLTSAPHANAIAPPPPP